MAQEETRLHTEATEAVALPSRGAPSGGEGPAGSVSALLRPAGHWRGGRAGGAWTRLLPRPPVLRGCARGCPPCGAAEGPWLLAARGLRVPGGLRHEGWSTTADGGTSPVTSVRPRPPFRAPRSLRRSPCHALWLWGDEAVPAKPGAPAPRGVAVTEPRGRQPTSGGLENVCSPMHGHSSPLEDNSTSEDENPRRKNRFL